jgi:RNA polymerase sigma-70 factor (ECF subfamily)
MCMYECLPTVQLEGNDNPAASGDEAAFVEAVKRYRRELHVHCYRMSGSLEDAEDLSQETLLRAWRARDGFEGRSSFRTWLYQIATNACLDFVARRTARTLPPDRVEAADPSLEPPDSVDASWLDPYPGRLLEAPAGDEGPVAAVEARETIELAFLAAIQFLPPRRRAVVILRDVLDWSARDTAETLSMSVASVNSTLQRARRALGERLGPSRVDWKRTPRAAAGELALLRRYMEAHERGDVAALAGLLREDVRISAPPRPLWYDGKDAVIASTRRLAGTHDFRYVATSANGQPAAASYVRATGEEEFRAMGIDVLRIEDGLIAEVTAFLRPDLFEMFGLPPTIR